MSDQLWVGTRKGLFRVARNTSGRWAIAGSWFLGDPVSMVHIEAGGLRVHAAQDLGHFGVKMQRSENGGDTWVQTATPEYPPKPEDLEDKDPMRGSDIPWSTQLVWALEAGEANELWCGTAPGGLFRSTDGGDSWSLIRSLWDDPLRKKWMGGGYDYPGIHSVLVDPRDPDHLTVAVSCGGVWISRDRGASWKVVGEGLRNVYMPPELAHDPVSQDPHLVVQCAAQPDRFWMQHHNGIFRSDDGGLHWHELEGVQPSCFGFAVAVHPGEPDTAWFVPAVKDEQRIPVDAKLVVNRTRDGGKTFEALSHGLPVEASYDLIYRHGLAVSADGNCLAIGSTTGGLWISNNQGDSWQLVSAFLPPVRCVRFVD